MSNVVIEEIARVAHEVNRAFCQSRGDNSHLEWRDAPDWQKESAIAGVELHLSGDVTPEQSHESWLQRKLEEGWRWGPIKNALKKEHPCCVAYSELPDYQKVKDYLFRAVVNALRPLVPAAPEVAATPTPTPMQDPAQGQDVVGVAQDQGTGEIQGAGAAQAVASADPSNSAQVLNFPAIGLPQNGADGQAATQQNSGEGQPAAPESNI